MGESTISEAKTIVLVGKTGNSVIGAKVFDSMPSSAGVAAACQPHETVVDNDYILNVIDTPGLFDTKVEPEIIRKKIAKCIQMAKTGIHAVLVILSLRTRFSEEISVIESLKQFFGAKIWDYMIVVFTHGDALEDMSLDYYLGHNCPEPLLKTLEMCGNRCVLFDNKTKDELKILQQWEELLCLIDTVVENNGGIAYSDELFIDSLYISEHGVKLNKAYEKLLLDKIELKLREMTLRFEKQLADEQVARKKAEAMAAEAQQKSIAEISRLSEQLEVSRRETELLQNNQIESEKKFKAELERLEQGIKEKLAKAEEEVKMLRKSQFNEAKEKFEAAQRRFELEILNKGNCAIL